jgi:RNA-directed DNA polymerase
MSFKITDIDPSGIGPLDNFSIALSCGLEGYMLVNSLSIASEPGSYREIRLNKRTVWEADKTLSYTQKKICTALVQCIPAGEASIAYEGSTIHDSVSSMTGKDAVLTADIVKFFDNIGFDHIKTTLSNFGYTEQISRTLAYLFTRVDAKGLRTLPQGGVASPFLANRVAALFIDPVVRGCLPKGWIYKRYCDNLIIAPPYARGMCNNYWELLKGIKSQVEGCSGFRVHKMGVRRHYQRQKVLGLVLNEHANVPRRYYDEVKAILHNVKGSSWEEQSGTFDVEYFKKKTIGRALYVIKNTSSPRARKIATLLEEVF